MKAIVLGNVFLDKRKFIDQGDILYEFIPDDNGKWREVAVSRKIDPEKIDETIGADDEGVGLSIKIDDKNDAYEILLATLQSIESQFSIATKGSLYKILWEDNKREYIPESEEDARSMGLRSINISKIPPFPDPKFSLDEEKLEKLVGRLEELSEMDVALAFWREGMNELRANRFIQAFYNFYFIIEGYYANGKTGEKQVIKEFSRSEDLKKIIEGMLPSIVSNEGHKENLANLYGKFNLPIDVPGTFKLLFRIRGALHHISFRSTKIQGTPLNKDSYVSIAVLARSIAEPTLNLRAKELLEQ